MWTAPLLLTCWIKLFAACDSRVRWTVCGLKDPRNITNSFCAQRFIHIELSENKKRVNVSLLLSEALGLQPLTILWFRHPVNRPLRIHGILRIVLCINLHSYLAIMKAKAKLFFYVCRWWSCEFKDPFVNDVVQIASCEWSIMVHYRH